MTPLELALEREANDEIDYCDECEYVRIVRGVGYCGVCGKLLLPMMFERGQGYGPARRCEKRKEEKSMGISGGDLARLGPAAQRQILQKLQQGEQAKAPAPAKPSKMGNQKETRVMPNGTVYTFASRKEARRYDELALLLAGGKIKDLRLQRTFTLQEAYTSSEGERVRAITYKADFVYKTYLGGGETPLTGEAGIWKLVVEDAKGYRTDKYKMKRKMMQDRLGITIQEV